MEKKNMVFLSVIAVATLLTAVVGTTFSFFTATADPDPDKPIKTTSVTTPKMGITYAQNGEINMQNIVPGVEDQTFIFSVTNSSQVATTYNLVWSELSTTITGDEPSAKDLTYKIEKCTAGESACTSTSSLQTAIPLPTAGDTTIPSATAEVVEGSTTNYYKVTVSFAETKEAQNDMQGKSFSGKIIVGAAAQDADALSGR